MDVEVRLYGSLRDLVSAEKKGRTKLSLSDASTVQQLLTTLGIDRPVLVAVNAIHEAAPTHQLMAGDRVTIFEFAAGG